MVLAIQEPGGLAALVAWWAGLAPLLVGLALMMLLVVRGRSVFVVAPLCGLVAVVLSGRDPLAAVTGPYMAGFADYIRRFYPIFALGAVFGKLMEDSGAAVTVARTIGRRLGEHRACLAVVLACALLTYGGVSLFVVGFSVYPMALHLFRAADLPRRFIPAAMAFGSITFTMTSAGSPEIQNLIPIQYLVDASTGQPLTDARAGWPVSLLVAALMFAVGQWYLEWAIRRDVARGGRFEAEDRDAAAAGPGPADARLPGFWRSMAPLVVSILALNALPAACHRLAAVPLFAVHAAEEGSLRRLLRAVPEDATLAIFLGVMAGLWLFRRWLTAGWSNFGTGFVNGLLAVGSTAAVVGFGTMVRDLPAFQTVVDGVTRLPLDPLVCAALAVAVISGIAGSASGGQGIALPIIKPIFVDALGVPPRALHRVVAIASGTLDSLPSSGFLVMLIRNICGETHARAYGPIFVTTVLVPALGTAAAIGLFKLVPAWAGM
jgi:H+/gluconate symporter-like permease